MPTSSRRTRLTVTAVAGAAACLASISPVFAQPGSGSPAHVNKHVLLISVDGMHQSDLNWYVAKFPQSVLAKLTRAGSEYTNARTSNPSDSDPGGTALMTGVHPAPGSSTVWLYNGSFPSFDENGS